MSEKSFDSNHPSFCCSSNSCATCTSSGLTRRKFLTATGALAATGMAVKASRTARASTTMPAGVRPQGKLPLKVQPVLIYETYKRKEATSWRPWGGLLTEQDVSGEKERIAGELATLKKTAEFPLDLMPLAAIQTPQEAREIAKGNHDVLIMYAAAGNLRFHEALVSPHKWLLVFVRHRSGPVYLGYETMHATFLRKYGDEYRQPGMRVEDVVVDSQDEILWRLRALYGLKNTLGKPIVAVGGPGGWGAGGGQAPLYAQELWNLDIHTTPYDELGERIKRARQDEGLMKQCREASEKYLNQKGITLHTSKEFVANAFVLTEVFKNLMTEAGTDAMTIGQCMSTIMPVSKTTACLPLSLLNDQGNMAFCESDFVVIPSGILLHYISGKPVFLNDPTYPHDGVVTLAHCTAPRKMDGENYADARILTHFESDYGAAPQVKMKLGQAVTVLDPDFTSKKWLGFRGEIAANPTMDICRSQIDVNIHGNCQRLVEEFRGFHWMVSYGDYRREIGYAIKKVGVDWLDLSA